MQSCWTVLAPQMRRAKKRVSSSTSIEYWSIRRVLCRRWSSKKSRKMKKGVSSGRSRWEDALLNFEYRFIMTEMMPFSFSWPRTSSFIEINSSDLTAKIKIRYSWCWADGRISDIYRIVLPRYRRLSFCAASITVASRSQTWILLLLVPRLLDVRSILHGSSQRLSYY